MKKAITAVFSCVCWALGACGGEGEDGTQTGPLQQGQGAGAGQGQGVGGQGQGAGGQGQGAGAGSQGQGAGGNGGSPSVGGSSMGTGGTNQGGSTSQGGSTNQGGAGSAGACISCTGCCDGSTCYPSAQQDASRCGKAGSKCSACAAGQVCSSGECVKDTPSCSPQTCPEGCCKGGTCLTGDTWTACGQSGQVCTVCEPMAACTSLATCNNMSWGPGSVVDLYVDGVTVALGTCGDGIAFPDPLVVFTVGGVKYSQSCNNSLSCAFSPPLKIPNVSLSLFASGLDFSVEDEDPESIVDELCWTGALPFPAKRDLGAQVYKIADGSLTYRFKPAGF